MYFERLLSGEFEYTNGWPLMYVDRMTVRGTLTEYGTLWLSEAPFS